MATTTTTTNKPLNPRAQDLSPKGYNRAALFSGKALDFDGVNDIVTGSSTALPASGYTIATWFNLDTLKSSGLVVWGDESPNERRSMMVFDSGGGVYRLYSSLYASSVASSTQLYTGRWYFSVVTLTAAGAATIYINGKQDATGTHTMAAYTGTQYKIGDSGSSEFTDGKIAGVRVFNQVLTPAQVADLYLNPEKITPDGVATSALKLWLPMMEGAGASAYDGSGNGNDGTIGGATWTAGVGAPVAQTALVSWNKGVNRLRYSEDITQTSVYIAGGGAGFSVVRTANYGIAPNGTQTAERIQITRGTSYAELYQRDETLSAGVSYTLSFWAKSLSGTPNLYTGWNGAYANPVTFTTDWVEYKYTFSALGGLNGGGFNFITWTSLAGTSATADLLVWGVSLRETSAGDAYIKTNATAQTSAVLVPEGLTAGASIFGTDIITPRNAFALNLDGASWAKVGANASTAFGTGPFTLEAWVKLRFVNTGSYANEIIALNDKDDYAVRTQNTGGISFLTSNVIAYSTSLNGDWAHIVALRETGGTTRLYLNGTQVASGTDTTSIPSANGTRIGTDDTENARTYKDQLANPRIYNRALTAAEVLRNYNADKAKFGL